MYCHTAGKFFIISSSLIKRSLTDWETKEIMMRNNSINSLFLQCVTFNNKEEYRMKATISLEGLLALIHGLSLSASNKRWLGEKLIEEARKETQSAPISASRFYGVWKDEDFPGVSADEMVKEIKESRKFKKESITW